MQRQTNDLILPRMGRTPILSCGAFDSEPQTQSSTIKKKQQNRRGRSQNHGAFKMASYVQGSSATRPCILMPIVIW
ncbi:hypothetical protein PRIC2_006483 [Phytophthora ramorum]